MVESRHRAAAVESLYPKGLSALVDCLRKYVEANRSRFIVSDALDENLEIHTVDDYDGVTSE